MFLLTLGSWTRSGRILLTTQFTLLIQRASLLLKQRAIQKSKCGKSLITVQVFRQRSYQEYLIHFLPTKKVGEEQVSGLDLVKENHQASQCEIKVHSNRVEQNSLFVLPLFLTKAINHMKLPFIIIVDDTKQYRPAQFSAIFRNKYHNDYRVSATGLWQMERLSLSYD